MGRVGATATGRTRWVMEVVKDEEDEDEEFFPSDSKASAALVDVEDGDSGPFS